MRKRSTGAQTHVALLRGINVGGKNRLAMADLVELVEECGCRNVRTYIQSGNVVFEAAATVARGVAERLENLLAVKADLGVPVVTRSAVELRAVAAANPFLAQGADPEFLHVAFLRDKPSSTRIGALDPMRSPPDRFAVAGREIYLQCPNGIARSKLTNAWFDSSLTTVSTMRNWNTLQKLIELCS